jgi:D-cysteine desulfhydrase family pyridoxal phosphate-dependent enzyme
MKLDALCATLEEREPVDLGHLPTPIEPLTRLRVVLGGPEIWVKRDDLTGLATGGNKVRKLRFLMADVLRQEAEVVMTTGAQQSNHARQTAAAAARFGLACVLVLGGDPPSAAPQGNYLLDRIVGAEVRWAGDTPIPQALMEEAAREREAGRRVYVVPYGGSNAVGVCGYVEAMAEVWAQAPNVQWFDKIIVASSSGGTQAGLLVGARALGYEGEIHGISIAEPAPVFREQIATHANHSIQHLGLAIPPIVADDVTVHDAYLGGGYGVVGGLEREAIALAGQTEGLLVDPVYSGRALGGMIDLIRRGEIGPGERVLFWHTGGTPALFAYADEIARIVTK